MDNEQEIHPGPWGEFPDRYWGAYFGSDSAYYMGELMKLRAARSLEFRFVAFFFGVLWMTYRKMYVVALSTFLLIMLEGTLEGVIEELIPEVASIVEGAGSLISIGLSVALGIYGNRLYLWDARRNIRQVLVEMPVAHEQEIMARIASRGGTSGLAVLLAVVLIVLMMLVGANLIDAANSFS